MAKKLVEEFVIHMPAGKATPAPPIGPMLGQKGINIGQFVKEFNDKTRELMQKFGGMDIKVPVKVKVYNEDLTRWKFCHLLLLILFYGKFELRKVLVNLIRKK